MLKYIEIVKKKITSVPILTHFGPTLTIKLTVDASQYGIGAIISHVFADKTKKPVVFASRLLNSAELSYSQIEKEAAAIIFGVKKFFQYLYGKNSFLCFRRFNYKMNKVFHSKQRVFGNGNQNITRNFCKICFTKGTHFV